MKVNEARKLTFNSSKEYKNSIKKLNKMIRTECKKGKFEMQLFRDGNDYIPSDEVYYSLVAYLGRSGFRVEMNQHGNLISW